MIKHTLVATFTLIMLIVTAACNEQPASHKDNAIPAAPIPAAIKETRTFKEQIPIYINGANHAHAHHKTRGYGSALSMEQLKILKANNINLIAITPFGFQYNFSQNTISGYGGSPDAEHGFGKIDPSMPDTAIRQEINNAHQLGIQVMIKPHIWSQDFHDPTSGAWHGSIHQKTKEDHQKWFDAYTAMILHFAKIAEEEKAQWFCIGTELKDLTGQHPESWPKLIKKVRAVYSGKLTYSAHWPDEFEKIQWWDQMDAIGIGAYYPLDGAPENPTVQQLKQEWLKHLPRLEAAARKHNKPILFTELGYTPTSQAHIKPWTHGDGKYDEQTQANAFQAFYESFEDKQWFRGVIWWKTFTDGRTERKGFTFVERPAVKHVKTWGQKMEATFITND